MATPGLLLAGLVLTAGAAAQQPPTGSWVEYWSPAPDIHGLGGLVRIAPDGAIYTAVTSSDADGHEDIALVCYSSAGALLWSVTYDGPGHGDDVPTDLELTPEGVSLVGASLGAEGPETVLLDFDASGTLLREHRTIGPDMPGFMRPQLAIGADGRRVIVTDDNATRFATAAYSATGDVIYHEVTAFGTIGGASAVEVTSDGHAYVVTIEDMTGHAAYVVRFIDPTGKERWISHHPTDTGLALGDAHVVVQPDGGAVVVATPEVFCPTTKVRAWRHDAAGNVLWTIDLPEGGCDFQSAVRVRRGPDGSIYLGTRAGAGSNLWRLDGDGKVAWVRPLLSAPFSLLADLDVTPDGSIVVLVNEFTTGFSALGANILAFDADGDVEWSRRWVDPEGGADSQLVAVAAEGGSVLLAGISKAPAAVWRAMTLRLAFGCPGDADASGAIDVSDLIGLLEAWGPSDDDFADVDQDGIVGVSDLVALLAAWGACE